MAEESLNAPDDELLRDVKEDFIDSEILIEQIAARDRNAMRMFYSRHSTILYRLLFPIIKDEGLAKESNKRSVSQRLAAGETVREGLVGVGLVSPDRVVQARRIRHGNTQRENSCKNWFVSGETR